MSKNIRIKPRYARSSTGGQTTENQILELHAIAGRHGWTVAAVFDDNDTSGGVGREDGPAMKALLRAVAWREVNMVAAWAGADRLGRSLIELHAKMIDPRPDQHGLDACAP